MLKWAVAPEDRRRRDFHNRRPTFQKRRKLSLPNAQPKEIQNMNQDPGKELKNAPNDYTRIQCGTRIEDEVESKSLFYMSLDHLPLAIVKQYERMIQEAENVSRVPHTTTQTQVETQVETEMVVRTEERDVPRIKEAVHRPLKVHTGILLSNQKYSEDDSSSTTSTSGTSSWMPLKKGHIHRSSSLPLKLQWNQEGKKMSTKIKNVSPGDFQFIT